MTHYRCCGQVYISEAAFSEHLREEHGSTPDDLLSAPFSTFSTATLFVKVDKVHGLPSCYYVEAFHNSHNGDLRSKEVKE